MSHLTHQRNPSQELLSPARSSASSVSSRDFQSRSRGQSDSTSVDSCFAELQDEMDMNALHEPGVAQGFSFPGGSSESAAKPARVPRRKAADHHSAHRRYQSDPGPLNGLFTDVLPRGGSHFDFLNSPPATNGFGIGFDQDHRRVGSSESINSSESQNDQTGAQNWLGPTDTLDSSMESHELGYDNDRENDSDSMAGSLDSLPHDPKTDFSDLQVEGVGMPLPPLPRTDSGDAYFFRHHHMPAKAREQPGSEPGVRRGRNGLSPPSQTMQPPQSRSLRAGISNSDARNHKAQSANIQSANHFDALGTAIDVEDDLSFMSDSDGAPAPAASESRSLTKKKSKSNLKSVPSFSISTKPDPSATHNSFAAHQRPGTSGMGYSAAQTARQRQDQAILHQQMLHQPHHMLMHGSPLPLHSPPTQHRRRKSKRANEIVSLHGGTPRNQRNRRSSDVYGAAPSPKLPMRPLDRVHRFRQSAHGHKRGFSDPGFSFLNKGNFAHLVREGNAPGHQRKRSRGGYRCKFCSQLKKGHICPNIAISIVSDDGAKRGISTKIDTAFTKMALP